MVKADVQCMFDDKLEWPYLISQNDFSIPQYVKVFSIIFPFLFADLSVASSDTHRE